MESRTLEELEELRTEMVKLITEYGVCDPLVLKVSQKIDKLHVMFEKEKFYQDNKNNDLQIFENHYPFAEGF